MQDASGRLSLFWVHDLHAGAQSLEQVHLQPREGPGGLMQSNPATPPELWSYLVQVSSKGILPQTASDSWRYLVRVSSSGGRTLDHTSELGH